jgi:preprotein translocase subunit SecE
VARPTRSQRRARRRQQAEQEQAVAGRARTRQPSNVPAQPAATPEPRREPRSEREPRRGGFLAFVSESWAELKKVEWPGQRQVMTGTVVVIVACLIVGGYLWVADLAVKRVVQNVFLGQ